MDSPLLKHIKLHSTLEYRTFLEAVFCLIRAQFKIGVRSYASWARRLGAGQSGMDGHYAANAPFSEIVLRNQAEVISALNRATRYLPWHMSCLPRALAAQTMLRRRDLPSQLYIGIARGEARDQQRISDLHAWLYSGQTEICGTEIATQFLPLVCFRSDDVRP
jgi:hypothetical protein